MEICDKIGVLEHFYLRRFKWHTKMFMKDLRMTKRPIKKNGIVGIVVDVNLSDTSWYIVEDDEKKDGKYELYDCLEEELETIV